MTRYMLCAALILAAFGAGTAGAQAFTQEPVFDDQALHPQLLPRGSLEYEYAIQRKAGAQTPRPAADAQQIGEALVNCDPIQPLSPATREKCEIRARQSAAGRGVASPLR